MKKFFNYNIIVVAAGLFLSLFLSSCFKDPSIIAPPPTPIEKAKPFVVSPDSITLQLMDNDDISNDPHHAYVFSHTAPFLNLRDSSVFVLDTSSSVPRVWMNLNVSPLIEKQKDIVDLQNKMISIQTDTINVTGEDWMLLNNGQVKYSVRTLVEKGQPGRFELLPIIQSRIGPYTKDESFARAFFWKVTAKREIRINLDTQLWYAVKDDKGSMFRVRSRMGGAIILKY